MEHLDTNRSSVLGPHKSHSYGGRSGATSTDFTAAYASISVPDVLTPVEISPSLKNSTFSSKNAKETIKVNIFQNS